MYWHVWHAYWFTVNPQEEIIADGLPTHSTIIDIAGHLVKVTLGIQVLYLGK